MNRRANITEKNLDFSPTGITVPKADQSGEIVNQGAQNFAKGLMQLEDKIDTLEATVKLGDFNAAYTLEKARLQKLHDQNPKDYIAAAKAAGEKLSTDFVKGMRAGPASKFKDMTLRGIAADQEANATWAVSQEQKNGLLKSQGVFNNVELSAEAALTVEQLAVVLGPTEGNLQHARQVSTGILTPTSLEAEYNKSRANSVKNSLNARLLHDPHALYGDIRLGAYNDLVDKGLILPGELVSFRSAASKAMQEALYSSQVKGLKASAVTFSTTRAKLMRGEMPPAEAVRIAEVYISRKDEKDFEGNPVIPPEVIEGAEEMVKLALEGIPQSTKANEGAKTEFLRKFNKEWEDFLLAGGDTVSRDNALKEIKISTKLTYALRNRILDRQQYENAMKIFDQKVISRTGEKIVGMPLEKAFAVAASKPFWGLASHVNDMYSYAYDKIQKKVADTPGLTPEQKQDRANEYLVIFMNEINRRPQQEIDKIVDFKGAANAILEGKGDDPGLFRRMLIYPHPERPEELLTYGQRTTYNGINVMFLGKDGEDYIFDTPDAVKKGWENR